MAAAVLGGASLGGLHRLLSIPAVQAQMPAEDPRSYFLPFVGRSPLVQPPLTRPVVAHVHSLNATNWNGQSDYWNHIDQSIVNDMVDRGLMTVTSASTVVDAWRAILPHYAAGQSIAIKVNFNNNGDGKIDACFQTLNAVVRGLKQIGVHEDDVWVYDAIKTIPDRFVNGCLYPGVVYFDTGKHQKAKFASGEPNAYVTFTTPADLPPHPSNKITDVLVDAAYVINMPLFKGHTDLAGVSLGFKNHFGSVATPESFHPYMFPGRNVFPTVLQLARRFEPQSAHSRQDGLDHWRRALHGKHVGLAAPTDEHLWQPDSEQSILCHRSRSY